jgi:GT2 family glycosyltransferase
VDGPRSIDLELSEAQTADLFPDRGDEPEPDEPDEPDEPERTSAHSRHERAGHERAGHERAGHERAFTLELVRSNWHLQRRLSEIETTRWWRLRLKIAGLRKRLAASVEKRSRFARLFRWLAPLTQRGRRKVRCLAATLFKHVYLLFETRSIHILPRHSAEFGELIDAADAYGQWRLVNAVRPRELADLRDQARHLAEAPKISVLLPVGKMAPQHLQATLASVCGQVYSQWELCAVVSGTTPAATRQRLEGAATTEPRIRIVDISIDAGTAQCLNIALTSAQGEFVAFLRPGDRLAADALYRVAQALCRDRQLDVVYSDGDCVDDDGRHFAPRFRPQWCPDTLLSHNYLDQLLVARAELVRALGGCRPEFEGAHDYDLVLRLTEATPRLHQVSQVLYHEGRRNHMAPPVDRLRTCRAAFRTLEDALQRRSEPGSVRPASGLPGYFTVRYAITRPGKVSILIPTKDRADLLATCLKSIERLTKRVDYEVIVVDNNSTESETFRLFAEYQQRQAGRFRVMPMPVPFNFSRLMNAAASVADGEYLLLLNNDTEVLHADWLAALVEQAQRPSIACVGARLLYPNRTIQHAGVAIGRHSGLAGHLFSQADRDAPGYDNAIQCVTNYSAVTGACLMVRRDLYHELGGLDEAFAVDLNDIDFCLRAKAAGYHNVYLPHVCLIHYESISRGPPTATSAGRRRYLEELARFRERWGMYLENDPCLSPHLTFGERDVQIRLDAPHP